MSAKGLGLLALFFVLFFVLEKLRPLRAAKLFWKKRLFPNLLMASLAYIFSALIVRPFYLWAFKNELIPNFLGPVLSFLALDLSFYYWHRINHKVSFFWRFHNCHHSDPALDSTTAFRFHPGEVALSSVLRIMQGALMVSSYQIILAHEFVFQTCTFFHHSNIRLPKRFEKVLGLLLITPRLHGIHHSNYKDETDSNFGVIFTFWDRLHGTFREDIKQEEIEIGVPGYASAKDNKIGAILVAPFIKQKDYWTGRTKRPFE